MEINNIRLISHRPRKWEACGGLKNKTQPFSAKKFFTDSSSATTLFMPKSLTQPIKFVLRSDMMIFTGPLMAKKLHSALMKLEVLSSSDTSMLTALLVRHVKRIAHLFCVIWLPLVLREVMLQEPNSSTATYENGAQESSVLQVVQLSEVNRGTPHRFACDTFP